MRILYSDAFMRDARRLPIKQQKKLSSLIAVVQENPFHSTLHTKPLAGELSGLYSFRVTRDWRVIFQFLATTVINLVSVAHRKDIYR